MAIKIKAIEKEIKVGKYQGTYRYCMQPELYIALATEKVIREAALRSGVSKGVMQACWDAAGEVIKAWATEGHSVALPGLGTMRFGVRAKSVDNVNDVKSSLIQTRRIVFTPNQDLKDELANTSIQITCYDRNGELVKRVTSPQALWRIPLIRTRLMITATLTTALVLRTTDQAPVLNRADRVPTTTVQVLRTTALNRAVAVTTTRRLRA